MPGQEFQLIKCEGNCIVGQNPKWVTTVEEQKNGVEIWRIFILVEYKVDDKEFLYFIPMNLTHYEDSIEMNIDTKNYYRVSSEGGMWI